LRHNIETIADPSRTKGLLYRAPGNRVPHRPTGCR